MWLARACGFNEEKTHLARHQFTDCTPENLLPPRMFGDIFGRTPRNWVAWVTRGHMAGSGGRGGFRARSCGTTMDLMMIYSNTV